MIELYKELKKYGKVKLNEPLSKHTTFKIGGPAEYFIIANSTDDLVALLKIAEENDIRYFILGGGSNTLVSDEGFEGMVIKVNNNSMKIEGDVLIADAGCSTAQVGQNSIKEKLTGFEWGVCIPGTIGGAVRGNAGAMGSEMKDSVDKVEVFRNGEVLELNNKECKFGYRNSIFKSGGNDIILRVYLKLKKGENKDLMAEAMKHIQFRKDTQPQGFSSGCIFKNVDVKEFKNEMPEEFVKKGYVPAGWLIEKAGLKGEKIGNIQVSEKHANFIINLGDGKAGDIMKLIEKIKEKVYDKFGVRLTEEIHIL